MIRKEDFDLKPRLRSLTKAAISSYRELLVENVVDKDNEDKGGGGKDSAWKHFASAIEVSDEGLKRFRVELDDIKVKQFAETAVRDGYMNNRWLEEWLDLASYPVDQRVELAKNLFQYLPVPRKNFLHNVPKRRVHLGPTATSIGLQLLLEALKRQAAVILFVGDAGAGKSTALEDIAHHFAYGDVHDFECVVLYRSFKENHDPLDDLLNQILETIHTPFFIDWTTKHKQEAIEHFVAQRSLLILIDRLEGSYIPGLLEWLQKLPYPSKAILAAQKPLSTNYECVTVCRQNPLDPKSYPIEFSLFLKHLVEQFPEISEDAIQRIYREGERSGNPGRMRMIAIQSVIARLKVDSIDTEFSFTTEDLEGFLQDCYLVLTEHAKNLMFALIPFPLSATPSALCYVSGLTEDGKFDSALDELQHLGLVQIVSNHDGEIVLVEWDDVLQGFAGKQLKSRQTYLNDVYRRWVNYYCELAEQVNYCPYEPDKLSILEAEKDVLPYVLGYVAENSSFDKEALRLANCTYYYYVRGYWAMKESPHLIAAQAAKRLGLVSEEAKHRAFEVEWLIKGGNYDQIRIQKHIERLDSLLADVSLQPDGKITILNTKGYFLIEVEEQFDQAGELLTQSIDLAHSVNSPHEFIGRYRLGYCYSRKPNASDQAYHYLNYSIGLAEAKNDIRTAASMKILLAKVLIGQLDSTSPPTAESRQRIETLLSEAKNVNEQIDDRNQRAHLLETFGRYWYVLGDPNGRWELQRARQMWQQQARLPKLREIDKLLESIE